jgi:lysophospholipase L1-like esterase
VTMRRIWWSATAVAIVVELSGCGSSPIAPPPPPASLSLTCPATATVQSVDGNATNVSFDQPRTAGGTAPVTTTCAPQSGSAFTVGTSTVNCQGIDSRGQSASCGFIVNVQPPPRLVGTRFLAFGDSLTAGTLSPAVMLLIVSPPDSYPFVLQNHLVARYRQQAPVIVNEGIGGEEASVGGVQRFRSRLLMHRPEIVLLMEGTNDLLRGQNGANEAIAALRTMVLEAKSQGIRIALATIPPQRAGGLRNRGAVVALIPGFNDRIRGLASGEGIPLIDVYNGMKDDLSYIGEDDLHPTARGYDAMATIFFDAIKSAFEVRPTLDGLAR